MNTLNGFINGYIARSSGIYFVRQYLVILCLFVFGAIISDRFVAGNEKTIRRAVLAFPLGIGAFAITAYAMLVAGIPYNTWTVSAAIAVEAVAVLVINIKSYIRPLPTGYPKHMLIVMCAVLVTAAFATSGIMPVSISNDTMYYFKRYPESIVFYRGLRDQFDFFLTDTGLGVVSLDTIPSLFGFGETFGIREFFHINFTAFFGICTYERGKRYMTCRKAVVAASLITAFLVFSTPFVIIGHWALANMYFMEMFFMAAYTATDFEENGSMAAPLMMLALSLFRIEGTLFVVWLIICVSLYADIGRKLTVRVLIPMTVLFGGYCLKIFRQFYVLDNLYLFMSPAKAVLLVGVIAAAAVYLFFIHPKLAKRFPGFLPALWIAVLFAGNLLLLAADRQHYIGNLAAFYANLFRQSGWGMLPYYVIAMTVFLVTEFVLLRVKDGILPDASNSFNITMVVGFILMVLAASYGRGDVLAEEVGDSGNRVLLQVVPLVVIMYGELFMNLYSRKAGGSAAVSNFVYRPEKQRKKGS